MSVSIKKSRVNSLKSVADLFEKLVQEYSIQQEISLEKLKENWSFLSGAVLSVHTHPISLEDGILRVEADHPVYTSDFQLSKKEIISKINHQFGPLVKGISVFYRKSRFRK
ncbi:MAG: DUF721 domain-containing protein [Spirochaetes bacterium]|nr:DUF721 domain-containing protein [Spirochaetota bacterium]